MSDIFGPLYAGTYDALYRDKDYANECQVVERLLREHGDGDVRALLDLGCGTGNHAIRFAEMGYTVTGVERSDAMFRRAREKAAGHTAIDLHQGDIRTLDLGREFDAALLLFAVLGYQTEDDDVLAALRAARRHVRTGGLILFDVWFGPAVLHQRPSPRSSRISLESGELLREVTPAVDLLRQVCRVRYDLREIEGERLSGSAQEEHDMRFFFPNELRLLLAGSGFSLLRLSPFPEIDTEPDETTWNVIAVGRAAP